MDALDRDRLGRGCRAGRTPPAARSRTAAAARRPRAPSSSRSVIRAASAAIASRRRPCRSAARGRGCRGPRPSRRRAARTPRRSRRPPRRRAGRPRRTGRARWPGPAASPRCRCAGTPAARANVVGSPSSVPSSQPSGAATCGLSASASARVISRSGLMPGRQPPEQLQDVGVAVDDAGVGLLDPHGQARAAPRAGVARARSAPPSGPSGVSPRSSVEQRGGAGRVVQRVVDVPVRPMARRCGSAPASGSGSAWVGHRHLVAVVRAGRRSAPAPPGGRARRTSASPARPRSPVSVAALARRTTAGPAARRRGAATGLRSGRRRSACGGRGPGSVGAWVTGSPGREGGWSGRRSEGRPGADQPPYSSEVVRANQ